MAASFEEKTKSQWSSILHWYSGPCDCSEKPIQQYTNTLKKPTKHELVDRQQTQGGALCWAQNKDMKIDQTNVNKKDMLLELNLWKFDIIEPMNQRDFYFLL